MYGASEWDLNIIQHSSDRCHKDRLVSFPVSINGTLNLPDLMFNDFPILKNFFFRSFRTVLKQRNSYIACKFIDLTFWRSTQGTGKLYLREHAPWGSYSQILAIWTLRRLLTPRANMNAPIRDAFDCASRKPMRRHFVLGFPRATLSLSQEKSSGVEIRFILSSCWLIKEHEI